MTTLTPALTSAHATVPKAAYNYAIGYLRTFTVTLVIAHHTALAYHPFAPPTPTSLIAQPRWWQAFPVVDVQRWSGFSFFTGFNDTFFMSLMFFLSGLFVWQALERKGGARFIRARLLRLGLPFLIAAALLAPLAYFPTYLQVNGHIDLAGFWHQWISLGQWPTGPAWFVWVLLAFDGVAALLFAMIPVWGERLGSLISGASRRPAVFWAALVAGSALVYIPMAIHFNSLAWATFGPFTFQTSRILHYFLYFLIGIGVGAYGLERGLLASEGKLSRRWLLWGIWALISFAVSSLTTVVALTTGARSVAWAIAADGGFVLTCAASCFAFLALFVRFARSRSRLFDSMTENSYGIYLLHYAFVSWLQYFLLPPSIPAFTKWFIVFLGALLLSWSSAATLRRIPVVAKIV